MQTTKKTYTQIDLFVRVARNLLARTEEKHKNEVLPKESKLRYAIDRVVPKCIDLLTEYNDQITDLMVSYCSVDEKGNILKDSHEQYVYTPTKFTEYNKKFRELWRKTEVDAPQYIATELPEWLDKETKTVFDGFVLKYEEQKSEPKLEVVSG